MRVESLGQVNFSAGKIRLKNMGNNKLNHQELFENLAMLNNVDLFIAKQKNSKILPYENIYTVIASRNLPYFQSGTYDCIMLKKTTSDDFLSNLYHSATKAIELLEKKIAENKNKY